MIVNEEILMKAINKWGKHAQLLMVLEEMSELQKEILKNINRGKDNLPEIIEEIADVEIMLEQAKYIYNIEKEVADMIPEKLKKVKARLEMK